MKSLLVLFFLVSMEAKASPFMTVKERLRLNLWTFGLEQKPQEVKKKVPQKSLPEEIERPLRKL